MLVCTWVNIITLLRGTLSLNVIVISGEQKEVCTYMVNMALGGSRFMVRYVVFQVGSTTCSMKPKKAQLHVTYIRLYISAQLDIGDKTDESSAAK